MVSTLNSQKSLHPLDVFNLLLYRHLGLRLLAGQLSTASVTIPLHHGNRGLEVLSNLIGGDRTTPSLQVHVHAWCTCTHKMIIMYNILCWHVSITHITITLYECTLSVACMYIIYTHNRATSVCEILPNQSTKCSNDTKLHVLIPEWVLIPE